MEKNSTLFRKVKTAKGKFPRKLILENLLNYSKSIEVIKNPFGGDPIVFSHN